MTMNWAGVMPAITTCFDENLEIDHEFTERTTFIVTPDYKVAAVLSSNDDKINPAQHVEKSLEAVQKLKH